ncbi:prepilin peptidase [Pseudothermotoga thermarum]|uniref:Prepilin peptidase n=1 Tax=Pseudothermotoga thermarum DSM 5069 TaxID=688269 RepID=F7YTD7_9THEM|nr:A24 family peptidase [Pseudothermotoga thermarum]AEH50115.1 Prepilin peptidase [Pseudothermotoga thermarum DSM 5069]
MWHILTFVVGAAIGSFLNVVIYRLPRKNEGLSLTNPPRSICPNCKTVIRWYDNIPLVSFIALKGKCRSCGKPISKRYFFVELFNGLGYLINFMVFQKNFLEFIAMCTMISCVLVIVFIDLDFMLIPDATLILIALASFLMWLNSSQKMLNLLAGGFVSALFALLFVLYKGGIGSGDIILAGTMSIAVGLLASFYALMFASMAALIFAAAKNKGKLDRKQKIPFGSFLGPAFYITILFQRTLPWIKTT